MAYYCYGRRNGVCKRQRPLAGVAHVISPGPRLRVLKLGVRSKVNPSVPKRVPDPSRSNAISLLEGADRELPRAA